MVRSSSCVAVFVAVLAVVGCQKSVEPEAQLADVVKDAKDWNEAAVLYDRYVEGISDPQRLYDLTETCRKDWTSQSEKIPFSDALWMSCVYRLGELKTPAAINLLIGMHSGPRYDAHLSETIDDALTIIGEPAIQYLEKSDYVNKDMVIELIRKGEQVF